MELLKQHLTKILLSVLTIILLSNCVTLMTHMRFENKRNIKRYSDIKWTGTKTGIENKVRIDGFYINFHPDRFDECLIFYDDGTCVQYTPRRTNIDTLSNDISSQYYRDMHECTKGKWGYYVGVYKVENDLITANYYYSDFLMLCNLWRYMTKTEYKIENDSTLTLIRSLNYDLTYDPTKIYQYDTIVKYRFYKSDKIPSSKNKMQKKRWMWKDKESWKKWRKKKEV